jgi:hypothetical protein
MLVSHVKIEILGQVIVIIPEIIRQLVKRYQILRAAWTGNAALDRREIKFDIF